MVTTLTGGLYATDYEEEIPIEDPEQPPVPTEPAPAPDQSTPTEQPLAASADATEDVPVEDAPDDYKTPDELTYRTTATGGLYADQPDAAPAGYYEPVQQAADWQKVGPSEEQLAIANETGAPIEGNAPRTQEAADQLNSVRPEGAAQETYTPPVYGTDPATGAPMEPAQDPIDPNWLTRVTPVDEIKNQIAGKDGIVNWGDVLNPLNLAKGAVLGLGEGWDKGRQRMVEAQGEEAYNRFKYGDANYGKSGVLDAVGNALLVPYQQLNKLPVAGGSNTIGYDPDNLDWVPVDGFTGWSQDPDNADLIKDLYENGYNGFTGGRALWEYYVSDKAMLQKGILDSLNDPTLVLGAAIGKIAGIGKVAEGLAPLSRTEKVIGGIAKAANIALDPLGEGILPVAKTGLTKAIDVIPGASTAVDGIKTSKLNPFALTQDARNRIALDEAVTQGEALGRQIDEIGTYTGVPEVPTKVGRLPSGELVVTDLATGVRRPFNMADPMSEFQAADRVLSQLPYSEYKRMKNTSGGGGLNWYKVLFQGENYGLPKFYDDALPSNAEAHARYINMMIRRIDMNERVNPGSGAQEVIDGMYVDLRDHATGTRGYSGTRPDPHLARYGFDTIDRILDKGLFTDANAARHRRLRRSVDGMVRSTPPAPGTPAYTPWTRPFIDPTGRPTRPTLGEYGWDRKILFTSKDEAVLRQDLGSGTVLGESVAQFKIKLAQAKTLSQKLAAGTITPGEEASLRKLTKEFGSEGLGLIDAPDTFSALTADDINSLAARSARYGLEIKLGVRDAKGKVIDKRQPWVKKWDNATGAVKSMMLLNVANIIPFTTRQVLGNASTLGIANRDALRDYVSSPGNWRSILQRETGGLLSNVKTDVDVLRDSAGLGASNRIRNSSRTGTLNSLTLPENRSGFSKFLSPEKLRTFSQISDLQMRESLYKTTFNPGYARLRKDIVDHAERKAGSMGVRLARPDIEAAFDSLPPVYSAVQLRQALESVSFIPFGQRGIDWSERVARDYLGATIKDPATGFKGLRAIDDEAFKEMERVGFTFNETNLDAVLNRVTFYHYWNSRAGLLYAREAMRNPFLTAEYYRTMEGLKQEADQEQYPDYLRGWLEFMSTPLGFSAYFDPAVTFNTFSTFVDSSLKDPNSDLRSLTDLGRKVDGSPFMINPFISTTLYWAGLLGNVTSKPDPTGLAGPTRQAVNLVNLFLTSKGMQPLPGAANWSPTLTNAIASFVSEQVAKLGLDTNLQQKVEFTNPNAAFDNNKNWMVQSLLKEQNPGWDDQRLADEAAAIQDDWENPIVKQAADLAADIPYQQPTFGLPDGLNKVAQIGMNILRPTNVVARPTQKDWNQSIRGQLADNNGTSLGDTYLDPQTGKRVRIESSLQNDGIYSRNNAASSPDLEAYAFDRMVDGYYDIGSDQQQKIQASYEAIVNGTINQPVQAVDQTFTPEDIRALDEDQRKKLAKIYLTDRGEWNALQGLWDAKEQYKQVHPELSDFYAFQDTARQYPGGVEAWAQAAMQGNPDYAQYVFDQVRLNPELGTAGEDRNKMLVKQDAYRILMGQPTSIYDRPNMGPPGAYGPYIPGVPVGMTPSQAKNLGGGDAGGGTTTGNGGDYMAEKKSTLEDDIGNFYGMTQMMNAWDQQMGYTPGTSVQTYVNRVTTGEKKYSIDSGLYNQIKDAYGYVTPSKGDLKGFLTWAFNPDLNPNGELNVDNYLAYDEIEYARQQLLKPTGGKAPSNISELTSGMTAVRGADGSGPSSTTKQQMYTPFNPTPLLADPSNPYSSLAQLGPGLPLKVLQRQGQMVLVEAPGGVQGWIPSSGLRMVA